MVYECGTGNDWSRSMSSSGLIWLPNDDKRDLQVDVATDEIQKITEIYIRKAPSSHQRGN